MDDLKAIRGIGPAHEAALHKLGITSLATLAAISEPDKFVDPAVFKADDLASWIEQAKSKIPPTGTPTGAAGTDLVQVNDAAGAAAVPGMAAAKPGKAAPAVAGNKPARRGKGRKSMQAASTGPRRSIVLLVDDKAHGARGSIVSLPLDLADELRTEGKARRATLDDFRKAGKLGKAGV